MPSNELADTLGPATALKVAQALGAEKIYVPHQQPLPDNHPLVRALGPDTVKALQAAFPGERIYVPQALASAHRNARLLHDHESGTSTQDLAIRYGVSTCRVRQIIKTHQQADTRQEPA